MIELLQANWGGLVALAGILALFLLLRNRATRISELSGTLGQGEPIIVEVFSNA